MPGTAAPAADDLVPGPVAALMRVLGVDLGTRRIGVAVSDAGGVLASPYEVLTRTGDPDRDRRALLDLAAEVGAGRIVVGLPLSLDGSLGPAARAALAEVDALGGLTDLPVEPYDERLTTVTAERALRELNLRGKARRQVVDKVAAAVMLQAWLDGHRTGPDGSSLLGDGAAGPGPSPGQARPHRTSTETTSDPAPRRRRTRRSRS